MVCCPLCGSKDFFYVQAVDEYYRVGSIEDEGVTIRLTQRIDSVPHEIDNFYFYCKDCDTILDVDDVVEKVRENEKRHS